MPTSSFDPATQARQRLLYLHARTPSVFSDILGYTPIEPIRGYQTGITAEEQAWPYNTVHEALVDGWQIVQFPVSLLGEDYEAQPHRHWHCKQPGSGYMSWHQDSTNNRDIHINRFLGLYYPTDITPDMGPTVIVPGTQFRNAPTDRMSTYTNIRGQVPLVVKAGTMAFTHYDLWHGTAANSSLVKRHMIKFLFRRTKDNIIPTWNHDPEALNHPTDWNGKREDAHNILTFGNPIGVSQSDHYKERTIRHQCWNHLMGEAT